MSREPRRRLGLYPGTFDPVTRGHLDLVVRALSLCDQLIVAVAKGHHKQTLFDHAERLELVAEAIPEAIRAQVAVRPFDGLLVDFARDTGVQVIFRGLRVISDFEYESQMALMNKRLCPQIETVFLMPDVEYIYLNSTLVKEVARCGGDIDGFVSPNVAGALKRRFVIP